MVGRRPAPGRPEDLEQPGLRAHDRRVVEVDVVGADRPHVVTRSEARGERVGEGRREPARSRRREARARSWATAAGRRADTANRAASDDQRRRSHRDRDAGDGGRRDDRDDELHDDDELPAQLAAGVEPRWNSASLAGVVSRAPGSTPSPRAKPNSVPSAERDERLAGERGQRDEQHERRRHDVGREADADLEAEAAAVDPGAVVVEPDSFTWRRWYGMRMPNSPASATAAASREHRADRERGAWSRRRARR